MPRARALGRPAPIEFQVGPWQARKKSKHRDADDENANDAAAPAAAAPAAETAFTVETCAPVVVTAAASTASPAQPPRHNVAPAPPPPPEAWGQWRSRRRRGGGDAAEAEEEPAAVAAPEEDAAGFEEEEEEEELDATPSPTLCRLSGVAQLALLPSGDMAGHFVALVPSASAEAGTAATTTPTTPVCLALTARVVLAESSCMRDEEWSLLRLTLSVYNGGGGAGAEVEEEGEEEEGEEEESDSDEDEDGLWGGGGNGPLQPSSSSSTSVSFWVQRTGGDLCRLTPADLDDEQTADAIAADVAARRRGALLQAARPLQPSPHPQQQPLFSFRGESLFADAAAREALAQISARLEASASAAVVNAGPAEAEGLPRAFVRRVQRASAAKAAGAAAK